MGRVPLLRLDVAHMTNREAALIAVTAAVITALSLYSLYAGWSSHQ